MHIMVKRRELLSTCREMIPHMNEDELGIVATALEKVANSMIARSDKTNCCSNCLLAQHHTLEGHYCKALGHLVRAEVFDCEHFKGWTE